MPARHIDIEIYVVKEKIQNQTNENDHMIVERMLVNPLNKVIHLVCSENTQVTFGII